MKPIDVHYEHARVADEDLSALGTRLAPEIKRLQAIWGTGYNSKYAFLNAPADAALHKKIKSTVEEKQKLKPTLLIVIGVGGSSLGTMAVHEAVQGLFYNQFNSLKVYFADTLESNYISKLLAIMDQELSDGGKVLLTIISKSGTTTETVANAQVFIQLLQTYHPHDYSRYIVAITDEGSVLYERAVNYAWTVLIIPKNVGGRYSVFSAAGLFPLAMLGIDIDELVKGAQASITSCCNADVMQNPAALRAAIIYDHYQQGMIIHDMFVFAFCLKGVGGWYRQLMAESLGKKSKAKKGVIRNEGITPTVSVGSIDLHSMVQLYLAGPSNTFTTFVSVRDMSSELVVPQKSELAGLVDNLQGVSFNHIAGAMLKGVQTAYKKSKRPFISVEIPHISAYYIGLLLQAEMIQMVYLGFLLEVNPFNQPQVELYKKETRKILSNE